MDVDKWLTSPCKLIELVKYGLLVFAWTESTFPILDVMDDEDLDGFTESSRCWYLFDVDEVAELAEDDDAPNYTNKNIQSSLTNTSRDYFNFELKFFVLE